MKLYCIEFYSLFLTGILRSGVHYNGVWPCSIYYEHKVARAWFGRPQRRPQQCKNPIQIWGIFNRVIVGSCGTFGQESLRPPKLFNLIRLWVRTAVVPVISNTSMKQSNVTTRTEKLEPSLRLQISYTDAVVSLESKVQHAFAVQLFSRAPQPKYPPVVLSFTIYCEHSEFLLEFLIFCLQRESSVKVLSR